MVFVIPENESHSAVSESADCMDWVHGTLQARILEWVAVPFSRGSSQPRDRTQVSHIAGGLFTSWATREALCGPCMQKLLVLQLCDLEQVSLCLSPRPHRSWESSPWWPCSVRQIWIGKGSTKCKLLFRNSCSTRDCCLEVWKKHRGWNHTSRKETSTREKFYWFFKTGK